MKPTLALAIMLAVCGCATNPPPPMHEEEQWAQLTDTEAAELQQQQEQARVEAPVRCQAKIPPKPAWPLDDPGLAGKGLYAKGRAALAEIELRRAYEAKLEAALRSCTLAPIR
jgi:hypothetical protein